MADTTNKTDTAKHPNWVCLSDMEAKAKADVAKKAAEPKKDK